MPQNLERGIGRGILIITAKGRSINLKKPVFNLLDSYTHLRGNNAYKCKFN
jgi:hypothetical protein